MFVFLFSSNPKAILHQEGICKSFLEIMEGYMTTREKHLTYIHHDKPGLSSAAPVFDPKLFKANKEVMKCSGGALVFMFSLLDSGSRSLGSNHPQSHVLCHMRCVLERNT